MASDPTDTAFAAGAVSRDAFLGGTLWLWQPKSGYRAGVDPVLLAASVAVRPGARVLELGCGVGAAILCLGRRVPDLSLTGIEVQPAYADLARRNAAEAGLAMDVITADLRHLPTEIRQQGFDTVLANPPYFEAGRRVRSSDDGREEALAGATPLATWIDVAARRLTPRGYLYMIQRTARLPDLLQGLDGRLGSVEVLPLAARAGRAPAHVLVRARKDGRAPFRLHSPVILHAGATHRSDAEDYTDRIRAVLRDGQPLDWPAG